MDVPCLLDCNILIAICDEAHSAHQIATDWFAAIRPARFATCPITQMSLLRHLVRVFPRAPFSDARHTLRRVSQIPGHEFWVADYDCLLLPDEGIRGHGHVTDAYLITLARARGGQVATLDQRMADVYAPTAFLIL